MKLFKNIIIAFVAGCSLFAGVAIAGEVVVIVNRSNPERVSIELLKSIYSDRQITWRSGQKIAVYHLPEKTEEQEIIAKKVLGMSGQSMAAEESRKRVNNTLRNPTKTRREKLVASIVSKKRWAIGYVPRHIAEGKSGVRIVMTLKD